MNSYLDTLYRQKWLILLVAAAMGGAAYFVTRKQAPQYKATSKMLVNQNPVAVLPNAAPTVTDPTEFERLISTQIAVARIPAIAKATLRNVRRSGMTPQRLLQNVTLTEEANADLIDVSVTATTPALAERLSTAYANAFARYQSGRVRTELSRELAGVLAAIDSQLRAARRGQLGAQGSSQVGAQGSSQVGTAQYNGQLGTAQANQAALTNSQSFQQLLSLRNDLSVARRAAPTSSLVVSAAKTATQVAPNPGRNATLALVLGLLLGSGLAFLIDARDGRARSTQEVSRQLSLNLLARIPAPARRWRSRRDSAVTMLSDPASGYAEAIKMLQANLEFARLHGTAQAVLFTSAVKQEGKSTTVANLAVSLAQSARSVVLVDADLRQPTLSRMFDVPKEFGLTELALGELRSDQVEDLLAEVKLDAALTPPSVRGSLRVLPVGRRGEQPDRLLSSPALPAVFAALRTHADWILVDTPPMTEFYDAFIVSQHVDALIAVARLGHVHLATVAEFGRLLASAPVPPLGFVATGVARKGAALYDLPVSDISGDHRPEMVAGARPA
jgi:capsular exopolysaccharide synthesis family protein